MKTNKPSYPEYPTGFLHFNLESCRKKTKCEGSCEHHGEGLTVVRVVDRSTPLGHDWGFYAYCPEAIKEDKYRGFLVFHEGEDGFQP